MEPSRRGISGVAAQAPLAHRQLSGASVGPHKGNHSPLMVCWLPPSQPTSPATSIVPHRRRPSHCSLIFFPAPTVIACHRPPFSTTVFCRQPPPFVHHYWLLRETLSRWHNIPRRSFGRHPLRDRDDEPECKHTGRPTHGTGCTTERLSVICLAHRGGLLAMGLLSSRGDRVLRKIPLIQQRPHKGTVPVNTTHVALLKHV